jgi:hypothetical protein
MIAHYSVTYRAERLNSRIAALKIGISRESADGQVSPLRFAVWM